MMHQLINIDKPDFPYIIIEAISREKFVSKGLYLIHNFNGEDTKLVSLIEITKREEDTNVISEFLTFQSVECMP